MFKSLSFKISETSDIQHHIYIKEDRTKEKDISRPEGRTLFAIGIPPFMEKDAVTCLFSHFGEVEATYLQRKPGKVVEQPSTSYFQQPLALKGYRIAYVIYADPASIKSALEERNEPLYLAAGQDKKLNCGIKKWSSQYRQSVPDIDEMQKEIDDYMADFDMKEKEQEKKQHGEPDDEGWITVTRKGKKPGIPRKQSITEKIKKREKKKELLNFYSFQFRESKMKNLKELREKFEEDKKRIGMMRQTRKFKPY